MKTRPILAFIAVACGGHAEASADDPVPRPLPRQEGIWLSSDEILALPTSGDAWDALVARASVPLPTPNLADPEDDADLDALAKALVSVRLDDEGLAAEVYAGLLAAIGTELGGDTLAIGRNLPAWIVAADLLEPPPVVDDSFRTWLLDVQESTYDGRTLASTHEDRPNNWGTHAGAARIALALYLGDEEELEQSARVFLGWVGDRDYYAGFSYREDWWQANPNEPVGINPAGSTRAGYSIDGVLPDDQRRAGPFSWPPPKENYVYEALQGALFQAAALERAGYDAFEWENQALLRAFNWLHYQANYPAEGDDTWQPHIVNKRYGARFPAPVPSRTGKNMGFTDWTHPIEPTPCIETATTETGPTQETRRTGTGGD